MLKKIKNIISERKKSELRLTPGENVRDAIIKAGIKTTEESAYLTSNYTAKLIELAEKMSTTVDRGTELVGGGSSAAALERIGFKTTKDIARGDSVCTGLCLVSGTCETIALCCSTIKVIPFRNRIYVGAKIVSQGCMAFRNSCVGEGC
jgi:hypothetical protein